MDSEHDKDNEYERQLFHVKKLRNLEFPKNRNSRLSIPESDLDETPREERLSSLSSQYGQSFKDDSDLNLQSPTPNNRN
jgi:hypothetical protein